MAIIMCILFEACTLARLSKQSTLTYIYIHVLYSTLYMTCTCTINIVGLACIITCYPCVYVRTVFGTLGILWNVKQYSLGHHISTLIIVVLYILYYAHSNTLRMFHDIYYVYIVLHIMCLHVHSTRQRCAMC